MSEGHDTLAGASTLIFMANVKGIDEKKNILKLRIFINYNQKGIKKHLIALAHLKKPVFLIDHENRL